ncbi:glucosaminidase domain-containing protein [Lentzea sp. CA-135723]|uniref:glucosaminidase domain-containing protein n=1 Tax=Lentzea sp. CA-135723 TaxID=3239950 RepID=UPI003D925451
MKKLTSTLLATAFAGLIMGTAQAAPPEAESQQEIRDRATASTLTAAGFQDDYIAIAGPAAQAVQAEFRIPASVTASQSILESDWGRSRLSTNDKNYFGFKCVNPTSPGPIAIGCHAYQTEECTPTCHVTTAYFRVYRSMTDSFRDYGRLITTSGIYDSALPYRDNNPDQFIREVAKKYATDPNYATKNITLMQNYNLYRFNTGGPSAVGSSFSGDAKTDIAYIFPNGDVKVWRNGRGFAENPWDADAIVASGFNDTNAHFADLDGDGAKEIITVLADGNVKAWRNGRGVTASPWDAEAIIGSGFTNEGLHFADLDGDRKAEIITVLPDGSVKAWHNGGGFADNPWDNAAIIATGFTNESLHFADLDADGKAEIITALPDGQVKAWHNYHGFANSPWDNAAIIGSGFTNESLHFADLDGDGKAEIATALPDGRVKAWHNYHGFANNPWDNEVIFATGFTNTNLHLI